MKPIVSLLLCALLLTGCAGTEPIAEVTAPSKPNAPKETVSSPAPAEPKAFTAPEYVSRFDTVTEVHLSDDGITLDDESMADAVFVSNDIIYYEFRDSYDSGNPYGEGVDADKHSAPEAAAHTVVNITKPGAYRITGKLSAGQIRIDLGEEACDDPDAVVELILQDADITCTVAPAILFLNTYECDGSWSAETAVPDVDTSAAGANLILEGSNTVNGAYVAKIFKDQEEEKKLWKQDGAIYSYMSMNVFGPGSLDLTAANEGLDTELHLTVNGGNIRIFADNDGINTNEDNVSVTTINGGCLTIYAGLGAEGDGIDSNGYLVINGGTVVTAANPGADAGLDADLGSFVHGGTVIARGSTMDWAESDSGQVTLNLQFALEQYADSQITLTREDGTEVFSVAADPEQARSFTGLILSHPDLIRGETYHLWVDGVEMAYTGTDTRRGGPGGMGGKGQMPEGFEPGRMDNGFQPPELPEGETLPEDFDPSRSYEDRIPPEGFPGELPEDMEHPEFPEDGTFPEQPSAQDTAEPSTEFYMKDQVNFFSGIMPAQ